jgi:ATP-dependent protease HslVU (ClpYQ) peptidase subunit
MTTVCVVRKGVQVAIAADSLVTFGDTRLPHGYEDNDKLFKVGDSYFGASGTTAHFPVLRKALALLPADELKLTTRDEVFDTFLKLHPKLKEQFFLNPKEEEGDPYESSQYTVLIANRTACSASTRTARCSSSSASGPSARAAALPLALCTRATTS